MQARGPVGQTCQPIINADFVLFPADSLYGHHRLLPQTTGIPTQISLVICSVMDRTIVIPLSLRIQVITSLLVNKFR